MSTTIDERVVEMRFDNKQFESNVQTSLNTLNDLKRGLDLSGAAKGLGEIANTAKNFTLDGLTAGVDTVHAKFSYLQATIQHQLNNIVDSAINAGKRITSALTIKPVNEGFSEYELKMGSIQTIMSSTGEDLETVNAKLAELNEYSDKTIYSFSDMTSNIGKFTNAGVKLDDAVNAIKGVSNVAAVSGANANEASRAMYNFAQALSSGYVKLIDWKSIENANMATVEFKQLLIDTAVELGTLVKVGDKYESTTTDLNGNVSELFDSTRMFNDSLSAQWMTTDVLVKTLNMYADETTEIGKKAYASAQDVKTFTQLYDTLKESAQSGWATSWELVVGDFEEAKATLTELNGVMGELIGSSADARNMVLKGWKDDGGRESLIQSFRNLYGSIQSVVEPIKEAWEAIFPTSNEQKIQSLLNITKAFENFTANFKLVGKDSENLQRTFKGLFAVLDIVKQAFSSVWDIISPYVSKIDDLGSAILEMTANWGDWLVNLNQSIKDSGGFSEVLGELMDFFTGIVANPGDFFDSIVAGLNKFVEKIKELAGILGFNIDFSEFKPFEGLLERINERFSGIKERVTEMKNAITAAFSELGLFLANCKFIQALVKIWDAVKEMSVAILDLLGGTMSNLASKMGDADFNTIFDGINTASLSGIAIALVSFLKATKEAVEEGGFFTNLVGILKDVRDCLETYQQKIKSEILLKIASAVGILAASLLVISLIDSAKLTGALAGMTVLFTELVGSLAILDTLGGSMKNAAKTAVMMIATGAAIFILAGALKKIGELDLADIGEGLLGIGGLLTELGVFLKAANLDKGGISTSVGIVILATALNVLASACSKIGNLDMPVIIQGLIGIGVLLGEIAIFTKVTANAQGMISTGVALIALGTGMRILASAIEKLGSMDKFALIKGLTAMGAALAELYVAILALKFIPNGDLLAIGASLMIISVAMNALGTALKIMGSMDGNEISSALIVMGIALAEFAIALNLMKSTLAGAAALLVAAAAIAVLTPSLILLGAMSWESIIKGLVSLAGAFVILGVAGAVLGPLAPAILAVSGALALAGVGIAAMGVGVTAVGVGLMAIATAFSLLATVSASGAMAIVTALTVIVTGVSGLIPVIIGKIGEGIIAFAKVITEGAPAILEAFIVLVECIVKALIESVPLIVEGIFTLLEKIFETIDEYMPKLVQLAYDILVSMLNKIADNIGQVVQTGVDIVLGFIDGISKKIPDIIQAGFDMLLNFINGITDCINTNTPLLIEAISNLVHALVDAAVDVITGGVDLFIGAGGDLINGLIKGLGESLGSLISKVKEIGGSILTAIKDVLGINSPSKEFAEVGKFADEGLIVGMKKYSEKVNDVAGNVGSDALNSMSNAISGISDSVDGNIDYQPTIRPVLDLTNIESGAGRLNTMLNQSHVASIAGSYRSPGQIAAETESTESLLSRMSARYADQLSSALSKSNTPINLQVTLEGDAAKVFKLVRTENDKFIKSAGYSPL